MKKEDLYESMNGIDDEILLKYADYKAKNKIISFKKSLIMAASICLIVVAASLIKQMNNFPTDESVGINGNPELYKEQEPESIDAMTLEGSAEKNTEADSLLHFSITAQSSDKDKFLLKQGQTIPVAICNNKGYVFYDFDEVDQYASYIIELPKITCEGKNIKSITYSINKHDLQVNKYIGDMDDVRKESSELMKEFTISVEEQKADYYRLAIVGRVDEKPEVYNILLERRDMASDNTTAIQDILNGTVINCEVTYNDGRVESANISVNAEYKTYEQLKDCFNKRYISEELYKNGGNVITFKLQ